MKFLETWTIKDLVYPIITFLCSMALLGIVVVDHKNSIPKEALEETSIVLKNWEWDGIPRHRSLLIVDFNDHEYYVDGLFLHGAFDWENWNDFAKRGDTLHIFFHKEKNGSNSIFSIASEDYEYMRVEDAMNAQTDNDTIGGYMGWIAMAVAISSVLFALGILFLNFKKTIPKKEAVDREFSQDMPENPMGNIVKISFRCTIQKIYVCTGQRVKQGDAILEICALEMYFPIISDMEGVIEEIYVQPGDTVEKNMPILKLI